MRLFFALWPTQEARGKLASLAADAARDSQGKPVPAEKLHATLAFLGDVAPERFDAACDAAHRVSGSEFQLAIDRTGSFHGARVAWAGCSKMPPGLVHLHEQLAGELEVAGFAPEERRYTPHITLARRTKRDLPPGPIEPVAWTVRQYALVQTDFGKGTYTVMREWRLGGR